MGDASGPVLKRARAGERRWRHEGRQRARGRDNRGPAAAAVSPRSAHAPALAAPARNAGCRHWPPITRIACAGTIGRRRSATGRSLDGDRHPLLPVVPADARHPRPAACRATTRPGTARSREAAPGLHAAEPRPAARRAATTIRSSGLAFEFLADPPTRRAAGADRPRERRHHHQHRRGRRCRAREAADARCDEPYRTLLGHMRHEVGHYYWDRLIERTTDASTRFRELFGDEREDYAQALQRTTRTGRRPTGRSASSAPTRARTRGRTGPRPGRTTCT